MTTVLKVKQVRSVIGQSLRTRLTIKSLGLRKIGSTKVLKDTAAIRGMVRKVQHLVSIEVHRVNNK